MARYGCLVIGVVLALLILFGIVYLWSGWLNRPVGRAPAAASTVIPAFAGIQNLHHERGFPR